MVNLGLLGFIGIIGLLILGVALFLLFRYIFSSREDPENSDIIINGLYNYTGGHGLILKDTEKRNKDLIKITGRPRDIDYIKEGKKKKPEIAEQEVFVKKNLLVPLPFSSHRKMLLALPDKPEHLPSDFKEHPFGKVVMEYIENQNEESFKEKTFRRRIESDEKFLSNFASNKIAEKYLEENTGKYEELLKLRIPETKKEES